MSDGTRIDSRRSTRAPELRRDEERPVNPRRPQQRA